MTTVRDRWSDYFVGISEIGQTDATFVKKDWDLGSERLVGKRFVKIIPILVRESRFHPTMFEPDPKIGRYHGGIIQVQFRVFQPNPHEKPGQIRATGTGNNQYWQPVSVNPNGELENPNPLGDHSLRRKGYAVGLGLRVILNNLSLPGSSGGWAHFPMFDIMKPPTQENVEMLIKEIRKRCGLEKFLILRSSPQGMMMLGVELVDEANYGVLQESSLLLNHPDVLDLWLDDRWHARSNQNFKQELGLPNGMQVCGILRATAAPPLKPEEPVVIAASF